MAKKERRKLYPEIEPFESGFLPVSGLHEIHYEQSGNPDGQPALFVHGRHDMVCPFENALQLKDTWPRAGLVLVDDAGHASSEPETTDALIRATDRFREL